MADRPDSFISRWSRRKRGERHEGQDVTEPGDADAPGSAAEASHDGDDVEGDPEVVAKLPDIESLDETSDFTPFMAKGVPEVLRRQALRRLWRLNPAFAHLDGLNDYDQDFTDAAVVLAKLKTIYKVGKGMLSEEAAPEKAGPAEPGDDRAATAAHGGAGTPASLPAATPPAPEGPARTDATMPPDEPPDEPAETAPLAGTLEEPGPGGGTPDATPRRSAAARRWGESSG
jgi:Protein of unknown function (DUF3306)